MRTQILTMFIVLVNSLCVASFNICYVVNLSYFVFAFGRRDYIYLLNLLGTRKVRLRLRMHSYSMHVVLLLATTCNRSYLSLGVTLT